MKKRPPYNENTQIRGALRRAFARHPIVVDIRNEARREVPRYKKDGTRAKKDAVQYNCELCLNWVSSTKIAVDHIEPVISTKEGFVDWNTFVSRLFCSKENLQRVCEDCHQKKTNQERFERNLKEDTKLIEWLESDVKKLIADPEKIKKLLQKFSKKKLAEYPDEFAQRIVRLKEYAKARKK